jgi:hypothetical protein
VCYRPHRLRVSLTHQSPAYLDEEYPVVINVINEDYRPLDVLLDVLLQPTEIDEAGMSYFVDLCYVNAILPMRSEHHPHRR